MHVAPPRGRRGAHRALTALILTVAILVLALAGLFIGSRDAAASEIWLSLFGDGGERALVWELRLPRTLLAVVVGVALGAAGAIMQSLTRNPLADPGLLGVNAGAAVAVALALALSLADTISATVWWAMGGALVASIIVSVLGDRAGRDSPASLVLAGAAVTAALVAVTNGVVLAAPAAFDSFRFWAVGSLEGRGSDVVLGVLPFVIVGLVVAVTIGRGLDALTLGDDTARALGVHPVIIRVAGVAGIVLLCGAATAAIGPIAFVGLTVPHIVRRWVPDSEGWLTTFSALGGAVLLLVADLLGRVIARPGEMQVGIVVAVIGAPIFIHIVRRRGRGGAS